MDSSLSLIDWHVSRRGGVIAGPQGLGILIGDDPARCPAGWVFLPLTGYTAEVGRLALTALRSGRVAWPESDHV